MPPIKDYYHDVDLKANQLFNSRLHNITTASRITLGASLSTGDKGYMVYDTNILSPFFWDGTQWQQAGGGGGGTWGSITGVVTSQTDLINYLSSNYYPLNSNPANYIDLTDLSAGTGISYNNLTGVITNSAPDQTVALSSGTGISVTGTYPNFTITNTSPSTGGTVTSVTASSPLASSGGTTPNITIQQASGSQDGYLSSGDWTIFNDKQNQLNGTGFVKASGTTISYDNSTYTPYIVSTNIANGFNGALSPAGLYMFDGYFGGVPNGPDASWNQSLFHIGNASRGLQIAGSYDNDDLYYRKGYTTWQPWIKLASQSWVSSNYQTIITNPVTGTGTATRVAFWDSSSSLSSDADLYWDNTNKRLGVGTITPSYKLDVQQSGSGASTQIAINTNGNINVNAGGWGTNLINGNINQFRSNNNEFYGYINFSQAVQGNLILINSNNPNNDAQEWIPIQYTHTVSRASNNKVNYMMDITPTYNLTGTYSGVTRGIYYRPTITNLNGTSHIAWENTSGDIIHGNLATGGSDEMVTVDTNGKLKKQVIPTSNPGTVTSVGLSMPSAFTVTNSPVISSGTLTVAGAGASSQYIRGDGSLGNFVTNVGGGSSVSYYLNGSVSQGVISGNTYYEMSKTANTGTSANFTRTAASGNGYIAEFITSAGDPALLNIPAGNWDFQIYFSASSNGGAPQFYVELYKVNVSDVFTSVASGSTSPETITGGTIKDVYVHTLAVPTTTLTINDRLAVRIYVIPDGKNITMYTQDSNLAEIHTTFSTGIAALNGLTTQIQYFGTPGTTGTAPNWSSVTDTHTLNIPLASASSVTAGLISKTDYDVFNNKIGGSGTTNYLSKFTASGTIGNSQVFDTGTYVGIGTATPAYTLDVTGSANFYLSGNTLSSPFNNKFSIRNGMVRLGTSVTDGTNSARFLQFTNEGDTNEYFLIGATPGSSSYLSSEQNPVISMCNKDALYIYSGPATTTGTIYLGNNTVFTFKKDGTVKYTPISTPSSPQLADSYFDSTLNRLRIYDGTQWITLDNGYLTAAITSLNGLTGATQTFTNDTNVTMVSSGTTHTITWSGTLADGRIASATNWNTAYTNRITSLTVTGDSGAATLSSNTLNIPTYTLSGLGGQPQLNGTGFVKASGTTISYDSNTYLTSVGTGTTNELTYWSGTNAIGSLSTSTYPSLTELSYVKGVTSAIQTQISGRGYSMQFGSLQLANPAASTNYWFGIPNRLPSSAANIVRVYIPQTGTVKRIDLSIISSTNGTAESWTFTLVKNNTTNYSIGSVASASTYRTITNSSMTAPVTAGDYLEITTTTPAWVTAPLNVIFVAIVYIQ